MFREYQMLSVKNFFFSTLLTYATLDEIRLLSIAEKVNFIDLNSKNC